MTLITTFINTKNPLYFTSQNNDVYDGSSLNFPDNFDTFSLTNFEESDDL